MCMSAGCHTHLCIVGARSGVGDEVKVRSHVRGAAQSAGRAEVFTDLLTGDYTHRNLTGAGSTGTWETSQSLSEIRTVTKWCL